MRRAQIIKVAAFLILAFLTFGMLSSVLTGSKYIITWTGTVSKNSLYSVPRNSLEVVSLGPSSGMTSFSPLELYGIYGISAYNYSTEQQAPIVSYYTLKEVIKRQKDLKVVFLNPQMLLRDWSYGLARKAFDRIRFSRDKLEGIQEFVEMKEEDPFLSYLFPIYKFHTRWKNLNQYDFMGEIPNVGKDTYKIHNGFMLGNVNQDSGGFAGFGADTGTEVRSWTEDGALYFQKIAELCNEKGIALILYSQPYDFSPVSHNTIQAFADMIQVPFIDFNMAQYAEESDLDWKKDIGGHQATNGAVKVSRYLAEYISTRYSMTDVRGDERFLHLEEEYKGYSIDLENFQLCISFRLEEYLPLLAKSRYSVFIAAKDEASNGLGDSAQQFLYDLGLKKQLQDGYRQGYLAVIETGSVIVELLTEDVPEKAAAEFKGTLSTGGKLYAIKTAGYSAGSTASIQIDGKEYAVNSRGLNLVVYDHYLDQVVDSVAFDTHGDGSIYR